MVPLREREREKKRMGVKNYFENVDMKFIRGEKNLYFNEKLNE